MFKLKTIFTLVIGIVIGMALTSYLYFKLWSESLDANQLTMYSTRVVDFSVIAEISDKQDYCFRYQTANEFAVLLKEKLDTLDYDSSSDLLQVSMGTGWDSLTKFSEIKPEKLRYQCSKT